MSYTNTHLQRVPLKTANARPTQLVQRGSTVIFPIAIFTRWQQRLEELFGPSAAQVILYEGGRVCGERSVRNLKESLKIEGHPLLDALIKMKKRERWGEIEFRPSETSDIIIIVKNCFEAKEYGRSEKPVCWFMAGYLNSTLSNILKREVKLVETDCAAQEEKYCTFKSREHSQP